MPLAGSCIGEVCFHMHLEVDFEAGTEENDGQCCLLDTHGPGRFEALYEVALVDAAGGHVPQKQARADHAYRRWNVHLCVDVCPDHTHISQLWVQGSKPRAKSNYDTHLRASLLLAQILI